MTDAEAIDGEDAIDGVEGAEDVATSVGDGSVGVVGGGGVEEVVDRAAGEAKGDTQDDAGDEERGDGVGDFEGFDVEAFAEPGGGKAEEDGGGRPDVG